jgi:hypothetical protein
MSIILRAAQEWGLTTWIDFFLVVGVKQGQPLLREAGLPPALIIEPDELILGAEVFWNAKWQGLGLERARLKSLKDYEDYVLNYQRHLFALVEGIFNTWAKRYGEVTTQILYEWALRHFVDSKQIRLWDTWGTLLVRFHNESHRYPNLPLDIVDQIKDLIGSRLPGLLGEDNEQMNTLFEAARQIPLSTMERRMVSLEVNSTDTDESEVDVVSLLESVIAQESAFQIWAEIDKRFTELECEALLQWGREQAALMNIPEEWTGLYSEIRQSVGQGSL